MRVGGFTESIWHFAGYLHLADALARKDVLLEGDPQTLIKLEFTIGVPVDPRRRPDDDDLGSAPTPLDAFEHAQTDFIVRRPSSDDDEAVLALSGPSSIAAAPPRNVGGGTFSQTQIDVLPRRIEVAYEQDAQQTLTDITQVNRMLDHDVVTDGRLLVQTPHGWSTNFDAIDTRPEMAELLGQALAEIPLALADAAHGGSAELIAFIGARDDARASGDAAPAHDAAPGRYVDGVLSDAPAGKAADAPDLGGTLTLEASSGAELTRTLTGPSDGVGTAALTGGNFAANAAVIRDLSGLHGSTIVAGDVFFSNAIIQINVLADNDAATLAIGAGVDPLLGQLARAGGGDGNALHNIAEYVSHEYSAVLRGAAFTPMWTVDVVEGDFFSVRALSQINVLSDDDRVTQTSFDTWYKLGTGGNQQVNLADVYGFDTYDVIVIGGDSHHANWIFQKNILLDSDVALSHFDGEGGSQTLFAGGNSLTNDARIITYGASAYGEMTDAQRELMAALGRGEPGLQANPEWQMGGSASGTLKVLYVTGDYYDINVISQTNIVSDADQVAQWAASQGAVSQGAVTGANELLNEARILDAGTLSGSAFAGGDVYHESILIQANIMTDQDTIVIHDNAAYAPELIAFTGEGQHDGCEGPAPVRHVDPGYYDSPGNVMS